MSDPLSSYQYPYSAFAMGMLNQDEFAEELVKRLQDHPNDIEQTPDRLAVMCERFQFPVAMAKGILVSIGGREALLRFDQLLQQRVGRGSNKVRPIPLDASGAQEGAQEKPADSSDRTRAEDMPDPFDEEPESAIERQARLGLHPDEQDMPGDSRQGGAGFWRWAIGLSLGAAVVVAVLFATPFLLQLWEEQSFRPQVRSADLPPYPKLEAKDQNSATLAGEDRVEAIQDRRALESLPAPAAGKPIQKQPIRTPSQPDAPPPKDSTALNTTREPSIPAPKIASSQAFAPAVSATQRQATSDKVEALYERLYFAAQDLRLENTVEGPSALDYLRQMQQLMPEHSLVQKGREIIAHKFNVLSKQAFDEGQSKLGEYYQTRYREVLLGEGARS